jgi:PAS domain S-box-containing protein
MNGNPLMPQHSALDASLRSIDPADELHQLYEQAPCGYHSLDENGTFIRINQTELTMLGYDRSEIVGVKTCLELLTPESQEKFKTTFPLFKQQGWIRDLELEMICKNGDRLPVSLSSTVIRDEAGNYVMSRSVLLDISDRKRLEADRLSTEMALRAAHQQTLTIWESMTDAYATLDHDWRLIYVNPAAMGMMVHLTGLTPDQILGKSHWEVFPWSVGKIIEQEYRRSVKEQVPVHFEAYYEVTQNWFEIHAYPSSVGLGVYFRDATERKQAEQKIQEQANLLAIATDAIFVYDLDDRILFWNQGAERVYGWSSAEVLGQDWRSLIAKGAEPDLLDPAAVDQTTWQGEVQRMTQTGHVAVVMSRRSVMFDDLGQPKSILMVDTDITEKKQLELQFLRAQRLESLGTLASGIAHDLNNVLTPILGIVQLLPLKVPNLDERTQHFLEILNDSARRGADLVRQILAFARGIEGKPIETQVIHLLVEIQKVIRQTFPKNIELVNDFSQDLRLISADGTLLHQIFMNLCVNARDAMPEGGTLYITAENVTIDEYYARMHIDAKVGNYVVVTIADTGMGIAPAVLDRIFEPFFTTKDVGQGTGLGLSTVLGIVKSHHGFINVYSELNKGTRFKVYFPATDSQPLAPIVLPELQLGNGELILVVDDELAVLEVTQATLESHGYKTLIAKDGIEAIAAYAEHKRDISVVVLDLMMPSLDAVTTIRTLHKLNPQVQIIAMSGLATNEALTKTVNEGVKAFLAKPFTALELLNVVAKLCVKS